MDFTKEELNIFRQWFNVIQDTNKQYLEPGDYKLAEKIKWKIEWLAQGRGEAQLQAERDLFQKETVALAQDSLAMLSVITETANLLRGMTLDPAIPAHAKEALWSQICKLEAFVEMES